jgi:hypothetical protein
MVVYFDWNHGASTVKSKNNNTTFLFVVVIIGSYTHPPVRNRTFTCHTEKDYCKLPVGVEEGALFIAEQRKYVFFVDKIPMSSFLVRSARGLLHGVLDPVLLQLLCLLASQRAVQKGKGSKAN